MMLRRLLPNLGGVLLAAVLLLASPLGAKECGSAQGKTRVIQFDHKANDWSACEADEAFLAKEEDVRLEVINTNAVLFEARCAEPTLTDEDNVAGFKDLFDLASGYLRAVAPLLAPPGAPPAAPPGEVALKSATSQLDTALKAMRAKVSEAVDLAQSVDDHLGGTAPTSVTWNSVEVQAPVAPCDTPPADQTGNRYRLRALFRCVADKLAAYRVEPSADAAKIKATEDLLGTERVAMKTLSDLQAIDRVVCASGAPCDRMTDKLTTLVVRNCESKYSWRQKQKQPIAIAARPLLENDVTSRLPEVTPSVTLRSRVAEVVGVSVGITHTELTSPKYSAVAPTGSETKVPTQTGEESRSGKLGLFATYMPHRWSSPGDFVRPGFEFGFGLDDDVPAAFVGASFRLGSYVRLGLGWTLQQVEELDGQVEGVTPVADSGAIRTRKKLNDSAYISFSLNIDSLVLFKKPEGGNP